MKRNIQSLFSDVPETYECINHILTFGLDILWRKKAVGQLEISADQRWLDCCTGTGETAAYLQHKAGRGNRVFAIDFSRPMIEKARSKPECGGVYFSLSEIGRLPFRDSTFHQATLSFAARNINTGPDALFLSYREINRILKPGGRFIQVETSQPRNGLLRKLFHLYIRLFVKPAGMAISGSGPAYAYLASTIPRFFEAEALEPVFRKAGFRKIVIKRLFLGIAAIHIAFK